MHKLTTLALIACVLERKHITRLVSLDQPDACYNHMASCVPTEDHFQLSCYFFFLIFLSLPPPPALHPPSISGLEVRLPLMPASVLPLSCSPGPSMPIFSLFSCPGSKIYGKRLPTVHNTDSNDRTNDDWRQVTHHDHR